MSGEQQGAAGLSPFNGFLVVLLVVAAIVGWILIGSKVLGVTSFFASFLFLWYWAAVEQADYGQWTQSVVGALVGLLLAWQSAYLGAHYGQNGMIAGIVILLVAIYVQVMNWVPIAVSRSTMLYLTVLAAPAILEKLDPVETAIAIVGGAVFFAGVVGLAFLYAARTAKP